MKFKALRYEIQKANDIFKELLKLHLMFRLLEELLGYPVEC